MANQVDLRREKMGSEEVVPKAGAPPAAARLLGERGRKKVFRVHSPLATSAFYAPSEHTLPLD